MQLLLEGISNSNIDFFVRVAPMDMLQGIETLTKPSRDKQMVRFKEETLRLFNKFFPVEDTEKKRLLMEIVLQIIYRIYFNVNKLFVN